MRVLDLRVPAMAAEWATSRPPLDLRLPDSIQKELCLAFEAGADEMRRECGLVLSEAAGADKITYVDANDILDRLREKMTLKAAERVASAWLGMRPR